MIDDKSPPGSYAEALKKPKQSKNVMRGRNNRRRGGNFERELVKDFEAYGLRCEKVPLSGATTYAKGDLDLYPGFDPDLVYKGEAKRKKSLPKFLTENLEGNDFLALREDRGKTLIVITLERFAELCQ
ncbi:hypothetical protein [Sphingorhabdus sp. SMR4y]|uniref:hypothetical protein n=1 Tax=Sphingorhabdus sp. SMR4y TaxID=2584094 RepID=UPI000B5C2BF3|nr:hypothetical protein [Sphingorhabdus sp. SMR4y]ASK88485.1 hypothetical protein SPHFLASMR4Y_01738 [Sphingorhabdus sp. SMR4y]